MFKSIKSLFIAAIIVRLLIIPFFYHPDIKSQHFHFQYFSQGIFNIYNFISNNKNHLPYQDTFNYLPLTYFTFGLTHTISKPLLGHDFYLWLNDWGETQNNNVNLPYYLFVLKLPYLIIDLLFGWFLFKYYKSEKILFFWLFNPINLYLIYVLGNFDILPAFLTFMAFFLHKKEKNLLSYLSIGIAIALKAYPLIFLPFLIFSKPKFLNQFKYIFIALLPILVSIVPFAFQKSFYEAFLGSGLTQKLFEFRLLQVPVFPILYIFILIRYYFDKSLIKLEKASIFLFFTFIGLVNFHAQWIIWFLPLFFIFFIKYKIRNVFMFIYFALIFLYIVLTNDNFLFWGHLIPIDSNLVNITSPFEIIKLKTNLDPLKLQNQIHSILLALGFIGVYLYEKEK